MSISSGKAYTCLNCRLRQSLRLSSPKILRRTFSQRLALRNNSSSDEIIKPPTAPKATPDLRHVRLHPDLYKQNSIDRNYAIVADYPARITELLSRSHDLDRSLLEPRRQINTLESQIGRLKAASGQAAQSSGEVEDNESKVSSLLEEVRNIQSQVRTMVTEKEQVDEEAEALALSLPNLTHEVTPIGAEPKLLEYINCATDALPQADPNMHKVSHVDIGAKLDVLDFASAATTSGWGWYFLKNEAALLEQALVHHAFSVALSHGLRPISPPSITYTYISDACGFKPRDANNEKQVYTLSQTAQEQHKPNHALTGTSEIPLAAMHAGKDIEYSSLPVNMVASSRCYRAEAGSHGLDTKGLYRVHEFTKVEMFSWCEPAQAAEIFDKLVAIQKQILTPLGLKCRVLEMPSTDLGASAYRKIDIEAFFPSRRSIDDGWGEVTSVSMCTDYQSRRLGIRVKNQPKSKKGEVKDKWKYPHSLNGTAMAVPRVLAAILENGWDAEKQVVNLPECLSKWMPGGISSISATR